MLAITLPAGGNIAGAAVVLTADATVEANDLSIVLDDTSKAGFVSAIVTASSLSTGPITQTYWNFSQINFLGSADADGLIENTLTLTTPYQADIVGFGASGTGSPLSVTNWQVDASFAASPTLLGPALLDFFNADALTVRAAINGGNARSTIGGEFQSPTDLIVAPSKGAHVTLFDSALGISDNAQTAIRSYQLEIQATNGGLSLDANVSAIVDAMISTNAGALSLGDVTLASPRTLSSDRGDIRVTSTAGPISLNGVAATAIAGGILVSTASTLAVPASVNAAFTAAAIYSPTAPDVRDGLVRLVGNTGLALSSALPVTAGRLELSTNATAPLAMGSLSVGSLNVKTSGSVSVTNAVPLSISDGTNTPTVEIAATDVTIVAPVGIRVVDGIKASGSLVLSTYASGAPAVPVDFVVTSTGDNHLAGAPFAGTLRDIIRYSNANRMLQAATTAGVASQPMQILFDEAASPVATGGVVTLKAALPVLQKSVTVNGSLSSEPGDLGGIVGINGDRKSATGFVLGSGSTGSTIRDVALYGFTGSGLRVETAGNVISGLTVGADRTGTVPAGLANAVGIEVVGVAAVRNVIGVKTIGVDSGNTIKGNTQAGVLIRGGANYNSVYGNTIEQNKDGIQVVSSIGTLIGSTQVGFGNTISANTANGIRLTTVAAVSPAYGARIVNNEIADNGAAGVLVEGGSRNVIGGTGFREGNDLARNDVAVRLQSQGTVRTQGNQVVNNTIADSKLGGILIDQGFGNLVQGNVVSDAAGGTQSLWGVRIFRGPQGLGFSPNLVYQNTVSGAGDPANVPLVGGGGIVVENSSGQVIGGPGTLANILVENLGSGIVVVGGTGVNAASSNVIEGNLVGTDAGGGDRGNALDGIRIQGSLGNVVRGNTVRFQDEVANNSSGIGVYDAIGLTAAAGNQIVLNSVGDNFVGIRVSGGSNTAIGGRVGGLGNWVFRNASDGILVDRSAATGNATATVIRSNRIGLVTVPNTTIPQPAGNGGFGVNLKSTIGTTIDQGNVVAYNTSGGVRMEGGRNAVVGSVAAGLGNVIRDNGGDGIGVVQPASPGRTEAVLIAGNTIRENAGNGITIADTAATSAATARVSGITIGRPVATNRPDASTNTIVANGGVGVQVDRAQAVAIIGNAITGNLGAKQIELLNDGNAVLSPAVASVVAPVLTSARARVVGQSSPQYDVSGIVNRTGAGTAAQTVVVDIYGTNPATSEQFFLGRVNVTIRSGASQATFRVIVGQVGRRFGQIAATSSLGGGTSEFSNVIGV